MPDTIEETRTGFGWIKVGPICYHIAVCKNCQTVVFMTEDQRLKGDRILTILDNQIECCKHPRHYFRPVRTL